jgi:hypothetical protein
MTAPKHTAASERVSDLLYEWIERHGIEKGLAWLMEKRDEIRRGGPEWKFFTAFSAVPRYMGKADLQLIDEDLAAADEARVGWNPSRWSIDQAARALLALSLPADDPNSLIATLDKVFQTADVGESVALYQTLPLLPYPKRFRARAAEGIRSNMTSVFEAVALDNPYPSEYLDDAPWNQMVLKAVFVGSPLHRIIGIDERANSDLAGMLVDYARERRAAARPVEPELWRPVGPFIGADHIDDLAVALDGDRKVERLAAALALSTSTSRPARRLLETAPELIHRIESGDLTWASLARNREEAET